MAFANLFTGLSAIGEDTKSPGGSAFAYSQIKNEKGGNGRKRKPETLQNSPYSKKQRYPEQKIETYSATSFNYNDLKALPCHRQNSDRELATPGFAMAGTHNHKTGMSHKGQNYTKNNHNANKRHESKMMHEGQRKQHHLKSGRKNKMGGGHHHARQNSRNGGGDWKQKDCKMGKRTKVMTQEFKDQNALLVDGRLLCRHHLWGRCVKGEECQLEHGEGRNDLIKEACKFYIQGFCTKGESCPYMHKSFPCKFFHKRGKCSQGPDCRFSHEPLNEVTEKLFEEALQRDRYIQELAIKSKQDSSGEPADANEPEITDTNASTDVFTQPLRPIFYNSEQANVEQNASLCQAEELPDDVEEAHPPQSQPQSPPSNDPVKEEPVCYSVEAVLGRQHFKPFPTFIKTPAPLASSGWTSGSESGCEVPYSADTFLRLCKSGENSTLHHTPSPPAAQTELYKSETDSEEVSGEDKKQGGKNPESVNVDRSVPNEEELKCVPQKPSESKGALKRNAHLPVDVTCFINTKGKRNLSLANSRLKSITLTHKPITQQQLNVTGLTTQPQAPGKSICFLNTNSSETTRGVASTQPLSSCDTTAASATVVSQSAHSPSKYGANVTETYKDSIRSFHSLFASPLLPGPPLSQSQPHDSQPASFSQESNELVNDKSKMTDSKQRVSCKDSPHKCRKIDENQAPYSPLPAEVPTNSKNENQLAVHQLKEQQVDHNHVLPDAVDEKSSSSARCGIGPDPSTTQSNQQQLYKLPLNESAAAETANSVLKTLFLCLSPYQQESVKVCAPSGSEKDKSSGEPVFVKTQQKNKKNHRRKNNEMKTKTQNIQQPCYEEAFALPMRPQSTSQTSQMSLEETDASILFSPSRSEPQVRSCGKSPSVNKGTQAVQHHLKPKQGSEEEKCGNGNMAVTPLKDLFKTLDTTVFHFGQ